MKAVKPSKIMKKYEEHLLSDRHTTVKAQSSMDFVKSSYLHKMKISSMIHLPSHKASDFATTSLKDARSNSLSFAKVSKEGWALPVRSNFKFNSAQKKILYNLFTTGEKTGRK